VKTIYWIAAGLTAIFMALASIPDLLQSPQALSVFAHLGYPRYLLPFLGSAKALAVVAVLAPVSPRLKEWAFAGLLFDLAGALYSQLSVGDSPSGWMPAVIGLLLVSATYLTYRMRQIPAYRHA
jgi:DoxX-like family